MTIVLGYGFNDPSQYTHISLTYKNVSFYNENYKKSEKYKTIRKKY